MHLFTPPTALQDVHSELFTSLSYVPGGDAIDRLNISGMNFALDYSDYSQKTTKDRIVLCKPRVMLDSYIHFFSAVPHARIVELGIFQGGSALFFGAILKNLKKLVAFDLAPENTLLREIIREHSFEEKVALHFNISQDSEEVPSIVQKELGGAPDIILDDCSHLYEPTKNSFQKLFPLLRPGGLYIIEDWWWPHRPEYQGKDALWHNEPALTTLVLELAALQGTYPNWISSVTCYSYGGMIIVQKGPGTVPNPLDMAAVTLMRDKTIIHI